jgi:5-methylcytosine-specific restriction endonuclease McrA
MAEKKCVRFSGFGGSGRAVTRLRLCNNCGRKIPYSDRKCADCAQAMQRRHNERRRHLHTPAFRRLRQRLLAEHTARHGLWCPGAPDLEHEPHPVTQRRDLTIDHVIPTSRGGDELSPTNVRVLCRSANSSKAGSIATTG